MLASLLSLAAAGKFVEIDSSVSLQSAQAVRCTLYLACADFAPTGSGVRQLRLCTGGWHFQVLGHGRARKKADHELHHVYPNHVLGAFLSQLSSAWPFC